MRRKSFIITLTIAEVAVVGFLLVLSFGQQWFYPAVAPAHMGFQNWERLFMAGSALQEGLFTSAIIAVAVALTATALGLPLSRMASQAKGGFINSLTYWPFLLSPVILAVILQRLFLWLGWSGSTAGVLAAHLYLALPYANLLYRPFWNDHNVQLLKTAQTLGGSSVHIFRNVLFPLASPFVAICFFQTFLISWFEFGLTQLIGLGKVKTLPILVFSYINEANLFYAAVASVLIILPPLALLVFNRRSVIRKI